MDSPHDLHGVMKDNSHQKLLGALCLSLIPGLSIMIARILVVDDEKLVRWAISNCLKRDSHEVFCAQDGEEAVEKARKIAFDLVITDFKMPGMNGGELLKQLKQLIPNAKVMILTAYIAEPDKQKIMNLGACEYVEKPFIVDEIRNRVQAALSMDNGLFRAMYQ